MSLPPLKTLSDAADYHKVVEPFIPQLFELPNRVLANIATLDGLTQLYLDTNPLVTGCAASIIVAAIALVVSELNNNYSQIDRLWSILPNLYVVHTAAWARLTGLPHARLDMIAVATTMWSMRLTYNYWRRGGYQVGSEDYRWEVLKGGRPRILLVVFNIVFVSFFQNLLLFAFSGAPAYVIMLSGRIEQEVKVTDVSYFAIQLIIVLIEWVTDGQQWDYQTAKRQFKKDGTVANGFTKTDLKRGFVTKGMWAYSRHPNFFAEQTFWFVLYNWSCFASKTAYNWAGVGVVSLILLFQASTMLTESITGGKYPEYANYQREVGMFFPVSIFAYKSPERQPRIIRTSELAKRHEQRQRREQQQQQSQS